MNEIIKIFRFVLFLSISLTDMIKQIKVEKETCHLAAIQLNIVILEH